jgi:hypothetical protein
MADTWLLLTYKLPREPTAGRVYVWRKLKQLGAVALQDAVWVLPATARTHEQFQWLSAEITELGGDVTLWSSQLTYESRADSLEEVFREQTAAEYRKILAALGKKSADFKALAGRYQQAVARDYFSSPLAKKVRARLFQARGGKKA